MQEDTHIDEYLISGTDPDTLLFYEGLARAEDSASFSLVEDEVVILDTETTGLDTNYCSLIEIGAVRMRGPEVIDRFETFVNPGVRIPQEIVELTGISDANVAGAPSPQEATPTS